MTGVQTCALPISLTTVAAILAPHRQRTVQRMKAHSTVLCIQDGTDLNYSGLAQCDGLGSIGTNQTGASSAGLHLHSTLVVTTEGLPLGLLDAQCHVPASKAQDDKRASADIPIEEKKTFSWIQALRESRIVQIGAVLDAQHRRMRLHALHRARTVGDRKSVV